LGFNFSIVFYDVTTLYFETFKEDAENFKKPGFSKDNKPQQPQIVIGLVVNQDGYPIAIDIFPGNTFEGHTMIPVLRKLQKAHGIKTLTVIADAGMLSQSNIEEIENAGLTYIVGARLGNMPTDKLRQISKNLNKTEGVYYRGALPRGILVCDYSQKRANKDRSDRKKQLKKAEYQIENPDKIKKRTRFVMEESKAKIKLNQGLIEKDELREGIKGYHTNLEFTENSLIIQRYKDLWHVEKSFRIAKSDLQARPIFHRKKDSIETHILIVFVSLCLTKSIELKTGYSIKRVRDMIWKILDIEFVDTLTNKQFIKRMKTSGNPMAELLKKLNVDNDVNFKKSVLKR
jgi:transposase